MQYINCMGRQLEKRDQYFKGTNYTLFNTSDASLVVKIYDSGFERYLLTETNAKNLLKDHQNIIKSWDADINGTRVMVFEKMRILGQYLKEEQQFNEEQILKVFLDLCRAAQYCHQQGLIHRDIRPENIALGQQNSKLWNFQRSSFQVYQQVLPEYMQQVKLEIESNTFQHVRAPEQNQYPFKNPITEKVDIYAIGKVIYYIMFKEMYNQAQQIQNGKWNSKLIDIVYYCLNPDPMLRPSAEQVQKYINSNLIIQTTPHSALNSQQNEQQLADKFLQLEFPQFDEEISSWTVDLLKIKTKYMAKTNGCIQICLQSVDNGPDQQHFRQLLFKAWNKKDKIKKFYKHLSKQALPQLNQVIIVFKALLLIHNYFLKGPPEVYTSNHRGLTPKILLEKIKEGNQLLALKSSKDKFRTPYINNILENFINILLEKFQLNQTYIQFFNGNYALVPLFNNYAKREQIQVKFGLIKKLLQFWQKLNQFSETILKEQTLYRLQINLSINLMNETYNILCTTTHILYAFKYSTNYNIDIADVQFVKKTIQELQEQFVQNYLQTKRYFSNLETIPQLKQIVPQMTLATVETIKNIPLLQQANGVFNFYDYLNYGNSIDGIKIPQSYGESLIENKTYNNKTDLIDLRNEDQSYSTSLPLNGLNQTRANEVEVKRPQSDILTTIKKKSLEQPLSANRPQITQPEEVVRNKKQTFFVQGQYENVSSDESDNDQSTLKVEEIKKSKTNQYLKPEQPNYNLQGKLTQAMVQEKGFLDWSPVNKKDRIQSANQLNNPSSNQLVAQPQSQQQILTNLINNEFQLKNFFQDLTNKNVADWIIDYKTITLDKKIGAGSSCEVFRGFWKSTEVAIKRMKIKSLNGNHEKEFKREIQALVSISPHPNLVRLLGISQDNDDLYIVTELCAGGTLFDLLHKRKDLEIPWTARQKMAMQIAQGMQQLHELTPPLIHRDLKSLNLLLGERYDPTYPNRITIKIADFGLARVQLENGEAMTGVLGTFHWMAPEIFESLPYSIKADVYSFGIVLWEICSRQTPYSNFPNPAAIMKHVINKGRPDLTQLQNGCPRQMRDLMERCWNHDPNMRMKFSEILQQIRSFQ